MEQKKYSIKSLIKEHDGYTQNNNYEFQLLYDGKTNEITTKVYMPSDILAYGIALAFSDIDIDDYILDIYFDDIKNKIKDLRRFRK